MDTAMMSGHGGLMAKTDINQPSEFVLYGQKTTGPTLECGGMVNTTLTRCCYSASDQPHTSLTASLNPFLDSAN